MMPMDEGTNKMENIDDIMTADDDTLPGSSDTKDPRYASPDAIDVPTLLYHHEDN
jgi:hypothetical protein